MSKYWPIEHIPDSSLYVCMSVCLPVRLSPSIDPQWPVFGIIGESVVTVRHSGVESQDQQLSRKLNLTPKRAVRLCEFWHGEDASKSIYWQKLQHSLMKTENFSETQLNNCTGDSCTFISNDDFKLLSVLLSDYSKASITQPVTAIIRLCRDASVKSRQIFAINQVFAARREIYKDITTYFFCRDNGARLYFCCLLEVSLHIGSLRLSESFEVRYSKICDILRFTHNNSVLGSVSANMEFLGSKPTCFMSPSLSWSHVTLATLWTLYRGLGI